MIPSRRAFAVAVSAVAAAGLVAGCKDKTHGSEQTLKLIEPGGDVGTFSPIGKTSERGGAPAGSGFAISIPLQDSSKKTVGEINATCIATKPPKGQTLEGTCSGTAQVPGGQLALNVGGRIGDNVSGAIVGGTGKYAGASGTFTSHQTGGDNAPTEDTFTITLP